MCAEAGLEGNFTNHSGKRTCASTLFQAGTDEQVVMHRTGHRSRAGVRAYKRHNTAQDAHLSKFLDPPSPLTKTVKQEPVTSTVRCMKEDVMRMQSCATGSGSASLRAFQCHRHFQPIVFSVTAL